MTEKELISGCLKQDRLIQQQVYKTFGAKVMGICKRYMKDRERAEEMAMNTFLNVFQKIGQYKNEGSFEGWIFRIAVNACLMELRKKTNFSNEVPAESVQLPDAAKAEELLLNEDIEKMLDTLPEGARIVFNLYAIEGYKHAEIADRLGISEGTSRSQLNYAKEKLKKTFFSTHQIAGNHGR
jgi:RNA polymerase sigma-70 factor (ECF subfamily)